MNKTITLIIGVLLAAIGFGAQAKPSETDVLNHFADLAHAKFEDSPTTAISLQHAVNALTPFMKSLTDQALRAPTRSCRMITVLQQYRKSK
jgi:uncharacterized iron-regulated protein